MRQKFTTVLYRIQFLKFSQIFISIINIEKWKHLILISRESKNCRIIINKLYKCSSEISYIITFYKNRRKHTVIPPLSFSRIFVTRLNIEIIAWRPPLKNIEQLKILWHQCKRDTTLLRGQGGGSEVDFH